jgi:hypothetical protein
MTKYREDNQFSPQDSTTCIWCGEVIPAQEGRWQISIQREGNARFIKKKQNSLL